MSPIHACGIGGGCGCGDGGGENEKGQGKSAVETARGAPGELRGGQRWAEWVPANQHPGKAHTHQHRDRDPPEPERPRHRLSSSVDNSLCAAERPSEWRDGCTRTLALAMAPAPVATSSTAQLDTLTSPIRHHSWNPDSKCAALSLPCVLTYRAGTGNCIGSMALSSRASTRHCAPHSSHPSTPSFSTLAPRKAPFTYVLGSQLELP